MSTIWFIVVFIAVLALIALAAWLVRRFAGNRLANTNRGRMPRLAVIDAAAVDGRRRLVLVRRDNIEHLLMIGGPTDIVVEQNIVRAMPGRDQAPPRPVEPPRTAALPDSGSWTDGDGSRSDMFDHVEPAMPEPPPSRPVRPSFVDEVRRPAPERRSDPLGGFTPEPLGGRPEPRPELRPEPMPSRVTSRNEQAMPRPPSRPSEAPKAPSIRAPERPAAPPAPALSSADQNLAEMAQRLEAALRRPTGDVGAPPVAPEPPPGRAAPRNEPPMAPPIASPKGSFENLEDEMASLLGRPKTPS
ncbi:MAG: flagellar biosynthesis protein FliO [Bradyrhizobium sp.]|uniref:flagellar biosynthetic protein FliO n=1 Tax=Bradyrhizobium sp. TaxID=376 RepID=UPI00121669AB|nr:flagellar biosynthetic protein FliO [Bradyrhizobium sp.]THD70816.1 MAG: flagellar biosynthesis protein FliO [Bradyrhizobium sp.]